VKNPYFSMFPQLRNCGNLTVGLRPLQTPQLVPSFRDQLGVRGLRDGKEKGAVPVLEARGGRRSPHTEREEAMTTNYAVLIEPDGERPTIQYGRYASKDLAELMADYFRRIYPGAAVKLVTRVQTASTVSGG
jgi:hypothetical protein